MVQPKADGGKDVPLDQCGPIEMFTEGFVTCEELRPDKLEHFKYMRERSAPELPGVAVVLPGDAVGYCDIQSCAKAA